MSLRRAFPSIVTNSITAGNLLCDSTEANAFIAPVGLDLSPYRGRMIELYSAANVLWAQAWISATAPVEDIGDALNVSNCTSSSPYNTFDTVSPAGFHAVKTSTGAAAAATADEISFITGRLYKTVLTGTLTSGTVPYTYLSTGVASNTAIGLPSSPVASGLNTIYETLISTATGVRRFVSVNATDYTISLMEIKLVNAPAAPGALLLSTQGGSRGWAYKHASMNPNAAMTLRILDFKKIRI